MMDTTVVKDEIYSFEIARRVVGRAALHLGIDSMTEQALDVMADVLLQYLTRTGQALSHLVESSRRTSAHVNVLDTFQACQLVTSPAVGRLHLQEPEEEEEEILSPTTNINSSTSADGTSLLTSTNNGNSNTANGGNASSSSTNPSNGSSMKSSQKSSSYSVTGWQGLAEFVFGPKWLEEKDEEDLIAPSIMSANIDENGEGRPLSSGGAGGKALPSALADVREDTDGVGGGGDNLNQYGRKRNRQRGGWDAPYPDGVPAFPRASATCANPHALPAKVTGGGDTASGGESSAYRKVDIDAEEAAEEEHEAMNELEGMSDDVFAPSPRTPMATTVGSSWGSINGNNKRKLDRQDTANDDDNDDDDDMPPTKKVKLEDGKAACNKNGDKNTNSMKKKEAVTKTTSGDDEKETNVVDDAISDKFLYVPSFYPRPPSTKVVVDERRTVVDDQQQRLLQQQRQQQQQQEQQVSTNNNGPSTSIADIDSSLGVRSSLVRMGQNSYWGSGWEQASTMAVPMGRRTNEGGGNTNVPGGATAIAEVPIIPMNRASGSRVSRILEGSMDAAAMQ
jgi:hypothetical protein